MKFVRWVMLLFSLYVLVAVVRFYVIHPEAISVFNRVGFFRLAGSCTVAIGCYLLATSILKEYRSTPDSLSATGDNVPITTYLRDDAHTGNEHPFKTAFRRRPLFAALIMLMLFSLPLLLELVTSENHQSSIAAYWRRVLIGEFVALAVFAFAWHKARRLTRNQEHESNEDS